MVDFSNNSKNKSQEILLRMDYFFTETIQNNLGFDSKKKLLWFLQFF